MCHCIFNRIIRSSLSVYPLLLLFPPSASSRQQTCPVRQQGLECIKAASRLSLFHLQTRGSQSDCHREKPSPSQRGCCFRAMQICRVHCDFPHSHQAIHEIVADTEPLVSLLCPPPVVLQQKGRKNWEHSFISPPLRKHQYFCYPQCGNFGEKHTKMKIIIKKK